MKHLFSNIIMKSFLLSVLPLIYPSVFFYALTLEKTNGFHTTCVWLCPLLGIAHLISLVAYGYTDKKDKELLEDFKRLKEKAPNEIRASEPLLRRYSKVIQDNADKLYDEIKENKDHTDIHDWQWMQAKGDEICSALHNFVKCVAEKGEKFSVSMMFRIAKNEQQGFTMMSRDGDEASHRPTSYRTFVEEEQAEGTYYKTIFDENPTRPQVLMNKREVEKHFKGVGSVKYSQFIAIPISCKGKTVGILQIAAYSGSTVARTKKEIMRLCDNYFSIAAHTMLMTDKTENILQLL